MAEQKPAGGGFISIIQISDISLSGLLLVAVAVFLVLESTWVKPQSLTDEEAFLYGPIGTDLFPLPVFQVLTDLFPELFQPAGPEAGDWIKQFGFIRGKPGVNEGIPVGFTLSNYRPSSGAPSPVKFVGFACGLCHTSTIKRFEGDEGFLVYEMGNTALDFLPWVDAFRTAVLNERFTLDAIANRYEEKFNKSFGIFEKIIIGQWVTGIRKAIVDGLPILGKPFTGKEARNSDIMLCGPMRTQPFKILVEQILKIPAADNMAFSKLPTLYQQQYREWGQYDGSVKDYKTRSVLAVLTAGATYDNLLVPEISANITRANNYTLALKGPSFKEVFAEQAKLDRTRINRGQKVYQQYCTACHGGPDDETGEWIAGRKQRDIIPFQEIGTDSQRVTFKHYKNLGDLIYNDFPPKHPLKPKREELRPGPMGRIQGFANAPLQSAFSRAPYLHNGTVLTMAELINLKPRREIFYRGANLYDPVDLGLLSPDKADTRNYYKFDTRKPGNSNKGHDYPWPYKGKLWDKSKLQDLLEYLKTI